MKIMRKSKFFATLIMLFSSVTHAAAPIIYVVKPGDTISEIALQALGSPVYRKNGSLSRLLKMNPGIRNVDLIFPGQKLVVSLGTNQGLAASDPPVQECSVKTPSRPLASSQASTEVSTSKPLPTLPVEAPTPYQASPAKALVVETKQIYKQFEIPHHLLLDASTGMTSLASTDVVSKSGASLSSSQDFGVGIGWQQDWTDTFSTQASVKFRSLAFDPPTSNTKTISDSKKFTTGLGLGATSKITSNLSLNYGASFNQERFMRGLSSTMVGIDAVALTKLSLGAVYQIYEVGKTSVGIAGNFDNLMGATTDGYTVQGGIAYQCGFSIKRSYEFDKSVELNMNYRDRAQDTSLLNFHERTVFGSVIFSFPLFKERENK